jgi:hypothetical protein
VKWVFRLLTLGSLAFAMLFPFFIKDESGNAMWSVPGLNDSQTPTLLKVDKLPEDETIRQVYKWQDQTGNWHYSDIPPAGDTAVQQISVSNKTNIIQSLKPAPAEEIPTLVGQPGRTAAQQETLDRLEGDNPLTLDRVQNILKDTRAVKDMMESRNAALEAISGGGE